MCCELLGCPFVDGVTRRSVEVMAVVAESLRRLVYMYTTHDFVVSVLVGDYWV